LWFSRYLPSRLVAGDPGIRDAAVHAIQACLPHARVIPAGAAAIEWRRHPGSERYRIHARERSQRGATLIYDVDIATWDGDVVERWRGLELRIVGPTELPREWPPELLGPYLERQAAALGQWPEISISVDVNGQVPHVTRRADGKPLLHQGHLSRSHAGAMTLTVEAGTPVGCDCEPIAMRAPQVWRDLLGGSGYSLAELVSRQAGEGLDQSATRVWCALECVKKAGVRQDTAIVLDPSGSTPPGWVVLDAGTARILTLVAPLVAVPDPVAFALLLER
jgi:enediyne polyketide synthase